MNKKTTISTKSFHKKRLKELRLKKFTKIISLAPEVL